MILQSFLAQGGPNPVPTPHALRAGPLSLIYQDGDLRTLAFGGNEVLRRIYAAVRDPLWATIPGIRSKEKIQHDDAEFLVEYRSEHRADPIHFAWDATLSGKSDGAIEFQFSGEALATFQRNRIGLCVLHPPPARPGQRARARYTNGTSFNLSWPAIIAQEQPVHGFHDLAGLDTEIAPGVWLECTFDGDVFETEDQRNWIDASFKTYCTPLRIPIPLEIRAGTRIRQRVRLSLAFNHSASHFPPLSNPDNFPLHPSAATIQITPAATHPLPKLGASLPTASPLPTAALNRIRNLRLDHLRVEWPLAAPDHAPLLQSISTATELGCAVELALSAPDSCPPHPWSSLTQTLQIALRQGARFARFLIATTSSLSTRPATLNAARAALAPFGAPVCAGSERDLYEINLLRPPEDADAIFWSMNPQVHAFDNMSIAETPAAAKDQLISARSYFPHHPLHISPITLKPRPEIPPALHLPPPASPPPHSDPRQMSLFAAAWTLAMTAALSHGRAASATFFDIVGWSGLLGPAWNISDFPDFPAPAHAAFPAYHVLADIAEISKAGPVSVIETNGAHPHALACLALKGPHASHLLLANFTALPIHVHPPALGVPKQARLLTPANAPGALTDPESFRSQFPWPHPILSSQIPLELPPHAYARIDFNHPSP